MNAFRSTDDIAQPRFRAHGRVDFHVDGRLLRTEAIGPFNAELVLAVQALVHQIYREMAAGPTWGQLVRFHESALASPDTLEQFTLTLCALRAQGLTPHATAYELPPEVEGATLMARPFQQCFEQAGLHFAHFAHADEAHTWLLAQLG
ncbi:hypothetical protein [Inhella proteolytica]|uniref:Uncharacterized protein n=1 Tax=Inhella proteolytica TaxID=2795029 RepID=A0A931IZP2_9BURK|nr:hypothetical protein [Inhella proteolytica]MBH9576774.1 hypothetical protein [Inhella proteolytica]